MGLDNFTYIVDDEFLSPEHIEEIETFMLYEDARWTLGKQLLPDEKIFNTDIDPYQGSQFNQVFFFDSRVMSPTNWDRVYLILTTFCRKHNIDFRALVRCKSNLTFPDNDNVHGHDETPHVDHMWDHLTLLYYINDADGDTILYNEKFDNNKEVTLTEMARVSPKAGRAVLFNGNLYHSPSTPTYGFRAVINFTFIGEPSE